MVIVRLDNQNGKHLRRPIQLCNDLFVRRLTYVLPVQRAYSASRGSRSMPGASTLGDKLQFLIQMDERDECACICEDAQTATHTHSLLAFAGQMVSIPGLHCAG